MLSIEQKYEVSRLRDQEGRPIREIARIFNVSTATIWRVPFYPRPKESLITDGENGSYPDEPGDGLHDRSHLKAEIRPLVI